MAFLKNWLFIFVMKELDEFRNIKPIVTPRGFYLDFQKLVLPVSLTVALVLAGVESVRAEEAGELEDPLYKFISESGNIGYCRNGLEFECYQGDQCVIGSFVGKGKSYEEAAEELCGWFIGEEVPENENE